MPQTTLLEPTRVVSPAKVLPATPVESGRVIVRQTKRDLHVKRKAFHMFFGVLIGLTYGFSDLDVAGAAVILAVTALPLIVLDALRFRIPSLNRRITRDFLPYMRSHEASSLSGATYFSIGAWLAVVLFPKPIAAASILCLGLADPIAAFVGLQWGRLKIPGGRTIEGSLACAVTGALVSGFAFYAMAGLPGSTALPLAVASGFAAALAEWMPIGNLDDNLKLPVGTGILISLVAASFGIAL